MVISPPFDWQLRLNGSGIVPRGRGWRPGRRRTSWRRCTTKGLEQFRLAYDEDGLSVDRFDGYGAHPPSTLRQFLSATAELGGVVRDVLLPGPRPLEAGPTARGVRGSVQLRR